MAAYFDNSDIYYEQNFLTTLTAGFDCKNIIYSTWSFLSNTLFLRLPILATLRACCS